MTLVEVASQMHARGLLQRFAAPFAFLLLAVTLSACSNDQSSCTGGLNPYKGKCLTNSAIVYVECTENKGLSTTTEIGGGAGGTFRSVADASLKLAYKKSQQEDTPVALQIVHDCLTIAEQASGSGSDRSVAQNYEQQVNQDIKKWQQQQIKETPHIALSKASAAIGETVDAHGISFWPNETVDIYVHATMVQQVQADDKGEFQVSITVPSDAPPPNFMTTIRASGESSAKSATATFHTKP